MNQILEPDKKYANAYIDDVSVHSVNWSLHMIHLDCVLQRIKDSGITLKFNKCKFGQTSIKYLGHVIGGGTHQPDPEKLQAISNLIFPKTKKQMKSLLGLINYYRAYVEHLSDHIKPLTEMVKRNKPVMLQPTENDIRIFEFVKGLLVSAPILRCPDFSLPFIIQSDASNIGTGSTLSQMFDNEEHPVAYASCSFTDTQRRWSTVERECYAIVFALKKFDNFIYGREVSIVTDHNPLVFITETVPDNPKLARWKLALQRYNITSIKHRRVLIMQIVMQF